MFILTNYFPILPANKTKFIKKKKWKNIILISVHSLSVFEYTVECTLVSKKNKKNLEKKKVKGESRNVNLPFGIVFATITCKVVSSNVEYFNFFHI